MKTLQMLSMIFMLHSLVLFTSNNEEEIITDNDIIKALQEWQNSDWSFMPPILFCRKLCEKQIFQNSPQSLISLMDFARAKSKLAFDIFRDYDLLVYHKINYIDWEWAFKEIHSSKHLTLKEFRISAIEKEQEFVDYIPIDGEEIPYCYAIQEKVLSKLTIDEAIKILKIFREQTLNLKEILTKLYAQGFGGAFDFYSLLWHNKYEEINGIILNCEQQKIISKEARNCVNDFFGFITQPFLFAPTQFWG